MTSKLKCPEVWADVAGYEGLYKISNLGTVCRVDKNRHKILNTRLRSGYPSVRLTKFCKTVDALVHRLVAIAFIPNPENKCDVNHKNGIKTDNCIDNLEWATRSENIKHAFATGLSRRTELQCQRIKEAVSKPVKCIETGETFNSLTDAANKHKLNFGHLSNCCNGKQDTCGGFHWQLLNR